MGHSAGHDIDPTFYRSPADAISAPPEQLAYVVVFDRAAQQPDALAVLDTDPASDRYGQVVGWADLPTRGDEPDHFGGTRAARVRRRGYDTDGCSGVTCCCRAAVLEHPRLRDPPGPASAEPGQDDQRGRTGLQGRPTPAAHPAPRPGRHLRPRLGGATGRRPGGIALLTTTPSTCRGPGRPTAGPVRGRRRLVALEPEHADQQRVGYPLMIEDGVNPEPPPARSNGTGRTSGTWPRASSSTRFDLGAEHADGPGAAPVARSQRHLGFRRRGGEHRGPFASVWVEPG